MLGAYELKRASDGQFVWNLRSANGLTILTSEAYHSMAGALSGILSCRTHSPQEERYCRMTARDGQHYFVLRAANQEPIGSSEMYRSVAAREVGIESCKRHGPGAELVDHS